MYKIFFKERALILTDRIEDDLGSDFGAIYKFGNVGELKKFIGRFEKGEVSQKAYVYHHDIKALFSRFKECFSLVYAAGGLVWNSERTHFLAITRLERSDLPKGKLEPGESFEEAAAREVSEECGLSPLEIEHRLTSTFHIYKVNDQPILKETQWFTMVYNGNQKPEPQATEHITRVTWTHQTQAGEFLKNSYLSIAEVFNAAGICNNK